MANQLIDSVITPEAVTIDSLSIKNHVFTETSPLGLNNFPEGYFSKNLTRNTTPDWYFILVILVLSFVAWIKTVFGKFLFSLWAPSYSYQIASKTFKDRGLIQKRFDYGFDLLYLINASLFLYLLNRYFNPGILKSSGFTFVIQAFFVLLALIFLRTAIMRSIGFIFNRKELYFGFLYHFFLYNRVLGMLLIPFLIAIPYTTGNLQEIIVFTGISLIIIVYIMRLLRVTIYILRNVVLFFYLILYLCILEILPVLVIIKIIVSLAQV